MDVSNALLIPLRVPLGVERPRVVEILFEQVLQVAKRLQQANASYETEGGDIG